MLDAKPCSMIPTDEYNALIQKMRAFFLSKNYQEICAQSRLSILAACEDPFNVTSFSWEGTNWPLPQTGQMWLEYELLKNPELEGVFCITTSYRAEPNAKPGRHDKIFPMFEFESHGNFEDLLKLEMELIECLGFDQSIRLDYESACDLYDTQMIEHEHEAALCNDQDAVFLTHFPERTSPFWNMKHDANGIFKKCDVILMGQETIGSAERSTDVKEMRHFFETIMEGGYQKKLHDLFGKERVEKELEEYFQLDFFPRFGAGVGMTRLLSALNKKAERELSMA